MAAGVAGRDRRAEPARSDRARARRQGDGGGPRGRLRDAGRPPVARARGAAPPDRALGRRRARRPRARRRDRLGPRGRARAAVITLRGLGLFAAAGVITLLAAAAGRAALGFVVANALAAGIVLADWLAADPGPVELEREPPPPLSIGRENAVPLVVRNSGPARRLTIADAAPSGVDLAPTRAELALGAGEERVLAMQAVPRRRGPIRFTAADVRVFGPLGVAFRERSHPGTAVEAVAWPDVLQLRDATLLPPGRRPYGERLIRGETTAREFES